MLVGGWEGKIKLAAKEIASTMADMNVDLMPDDQFDCPVCGEPVLVPDEPFCGATCEHLKWVYLEGEGFQYIDPSIEINYPGIFSEENQEVGSADEISVGKDGDDNDVDDNCDTVDLILAKVIAGWSEDHMLHVEVEHIAGPGSRMICHFGFVRSSTKERLTNSADLNQGK